MRATLLWRVAAVALLIAACGIVLAQSGKLLTIADGVRRNQEELRAYTWKCTREITIKGKTTESSFLVRHDDGARQEERLGDPAANKQERRLAEWSLELERLILDYTEFSPEQLDSAYSRAGIFQGRDDSRDLTHIQARGVVLNGDSIDLWVQTYSLRPRKLRISTSLDGEPVEVVREFDDLPNGPSAPARTIVKTETRGKPTVIRAVNSEFSPLGP